MTRNFLSRLEKLEARYPVGDLQSMSDTELTQAMFLCFEIMIESGLSLDEDEEAILLGESFFVDKERLKNSNREHHVEEWNTLDEVCDRIEKICHERGFMGFMPELRKRLDSLSFADFDKRQEQLCQSLLRSE